jgi:membrane-bound serine protease (ClpP class)
LSHEIKYNYRRSFTGEWFPMQISQLRGSRRLLLILILACSVGGQAAVLRVELEGVIVPTTASFIKRSLHEAATRNHSLLLIRLKTPGGLGSSMQEIVEGLLNSPVPVAVYVAPSGAHAASAGFFVLLASDIAAMAPGTNTGAAHPIFPIGGENKILMDKVTNDAMASLRSIADKRGRNREAAEKGVRDSISFTEKEALQSGLIDFIAVDERDLFKQIDQRSEIHGRHIRGPLLNQPIEDLEMTVREKVLAAVQNPNLAVVLGILGLLALYAEFTHPGLIVPGVVGALSLLLAMAGFSVLPVNYVAVLLIVLALGLLVAEVKVQGFGILGVGGAIALFLGILFLVESPDPGMRVRPEIALAVSIPFVLIFMFLLRLVLKTHAQRVKTGIEALIGSPGMARSPVAAGGKVFVSGELWDAYSKTPIEQGRRIRVVRVDNLKLEVEEIEPEENR